MFDSDQRLSDLFDEAYAQFKEHLNAENGCNYQEKLKIIESS